MLEDLCAVTANSPVMEALDHMLQWRNGVSAMQPAVLLFLFTIMGLEY